MSAPTTPPPHRITDTPPVFPCWLWSTWRLEWQKTPVPTAHDWRDRLSSYSHWHPDQPEPPTARPEQEERIGGWRIDPKGDLIKNGVLPPTKEETAAYRADEASDIVACAQATAPTAAGTPRTDAALVEKISCTEGGDEECTVYPVVEHVEADFARTLERELAAAQAEVARKDNTLDAISDLLPDELKDVLRPDGTYDFLATIIKGVVELKQAHADTLAKLEEAQKSINSLQDYCSEANRIRNRVVDERDDLRAKLTAAEQELNDLSKAHSDYRQAAEQQVTELGRERDELHALYADTSDAAELRKALDKRIADFLAEKRCCDGQDCGCMGVTRLQQLVQEEAGTQLAAARRDTERMAKVAQDAVDGVARAGRWGVDHVGAANDRERQDEAMDNIDKAETEHLFNIRAALHPSDAK